MPLRHDRGLEEVAAVLREDHALRRRADLVAGPPDALEPARDRRRALDLDDEVDRAHVDPELEAARRDDRRHAAGLELLLDRDALLAGDRSVVGADELLAGEVVEALGEPLREAAAVREDDRAAVLADQLEDRAGGSPARCWCAPPGSSPGRRAAGRAAGSRRAAVMSSIGTMTWSSSGLRAPASTTVTSRPGPTPPRKRAMVSSGRWVALRARSAAAGCCALALARPGGRGARGSARGGRRASSRRSHGPRRRSRARRRGGSRGPGSSASGRATRAS